MAINLTEFNKAEEMLKSRGIDYKREDDVIEEGGMIAYERHIIGEGINNPEEWKWDFVCSTGTYGSEEGLIEYWSKKLRDDDEDPKGWLTAKEVVRLIEEGV